MTATFDPARCDQFEVYDPAAGTYMFVTRHLDKARDFARRIGTGAHIVGLYYDRTEGWMRGPID